MAKRTNPGEVRATAKFVRMAPRKVRMVVAQIRNKSVDDARETLQFCERAAAEPVAKVLNSAIANAEHNDGADIDELRVTTIYVEQGTTLKRSAARAKGRGARLSKPTCHVFVGVGN